MPDNHIAPIGGDDIWHEQMVAKEGWDQPDCGPVLLLLEIYSKKEVLVIHKQFEET